VRRNNGGMERAMTSFEPISSQERLRTLDVLRGAALLGILLMNILVFGMPFAA
jgi:uncharacterized membrane protein YeiB